MVVVTSLSSNLCNSNPFTHVHVRSYNERAFPVTLPKRFVGRGPPSVAAADGERRWSSQDPGATHRVSLHRACVNNSVILEPRTGVSLHRACVNNSMILEPRTECHYTVRASTTA